ncbi:MAG: S24 family peptidase [Eubacteriales bacterium]|nr:S24 family peptidase [Eubacteriales bacterium]
MQDTYPIDLPEMIPIPVLGCIHAGDPVTAQECIEDTPVYIPKDWTTSGQLYRGLRVKGNSMLPKIQDGDRVIFRVTPECSSGDIVIARIDGDDATVKRFLKGSGIVTLQPLNPDYAPIIFTGDEAEPTLEILGVVVQLVRDI